ncbi:MAG: DUF177 domain-containing protein [Oscillospiraceae bacterium]|nr:DUF177 domain-containing protein [Oscillospiraceae bacterium]
MRINLHEIIEMPGGSIPFELDLETDNLDYPQIVAYSTLPHAVGKVVNEAGVLHVKGEVSAEMVCICDRCGDEFKTQKVTQLHGIIAEEDDGENPELFLLEGNEIDMSEIVSTCFILDMDTKFLCMPDCKGICPKCGKNLNSGSCACGKEVDPRFAVLEQLLDK